MDDPQDGREQLRMCSEQQAKRDRKRLAPSLPLVTAQDLPVLEPLLDDPDTSMGVRVGLLAELERRKLVDGPPRWLRLLSA